jgi:hypothetical protein
MSTLLMLVLVLLPSAQVEAPWVEGRLPNGVRWVLVDAPLMDTQVHFTLLPWGLLGDGSDQAQMAHLVEHALVRSVDPDAEGIEVDGVMVQGETMALNMRLETYAPLDRWEQALGWHGDWLARRGLDGEVLEGLLPAERGKVMDEVDLTTRSHFTHKWALAAWNQVVRHGAEHVAVYGDVEDVGPDAVLAEISGRVGPGPDVVFVSVGPAPAEQVYAVMEEVLGELPAVEARVPAPTLAPEQIRGQAEHRLTWDVPVGHYMAYYPLPDDGPLDRVAADALAAIANHRLAQRGTLAQARVQAVASADLVTPEGRWLLFSASLPRPQDEALVSLVLGEVADGLYSLPEASLVVADMTSQLGDWPEFGTLREMMSSQPGVEWIEAMQTLFLLYAQLNMDLPKDELPSVYGRLTPEFLEAFAADRVVPANRSVLVLSPRP